MVIAGTTLLVLGLLGVTAAVATAYLGKEAGKQIDKAIKNAKIGGNSSEKVETLYEESKTQALEETKTWPNWPAKENEKPIIDNLVPGGNPQNDEDNDDKKRPITGILAPTEDSEEKSPETEEKSPIVPDETMTNIQSMLNGNDLQEYLTKMRDEQWAREDKIRQEVQAREDSAYTRAVRDMQRAGINPNLMNVSPAESGGGITNATGIDYSVYDGEIQKAIKDFETAINNAFKEEENEKDRITDIIQSCMLLLGIFMRK